MKETLRTLAVIVLFLLFSPLVLWFLRPGGGSSSSGSGGIANGFFWLGAICFLPFSLLTYLGIYLCLR
jgi:hypothetical protein